MFTNILVPIDGSEFSEQAVAYAIGAARRAHATIHLVRVHRPTQPPRLETPWLLDPVAEAGLQREERDYLERIAELPRASGIAVRVAVVDGPVVEALARYIEDTMIDLVVMTTHGRGGLSRIWLGSVADSLVRAVDVPMLLMRPQATMESAYGRSFAVDKIVLPLDGTEESERMLEHAIEFGSLSAARYSLVQVVAPPVQATAMAAGIGVDGWTNEAVEQLRQEAITSLNRVADRMRARGLVVDTAVVMQFQAASGILEHAVEAAADVIAMATHGRTGWPRIMLGSVADKVLRGSPVPLLLLPPARARAADAALLAS
jgi:nucleotide-binding universal stress UspA family protein